MYESVIRPHLKKKDTGRFVALDIDSGEFEIANEELAACHRLRARKPEAQIWMVRVGSRFAGRAS